MNRRLVIPALAVAALVSTWAVASFACDKSKDAKTTARAASAAKAECSYSKSTAVTADAKGSCNYSKGAAVTADAKGACSYSKSAVTAAHEGCAVSKASAAVFAGGETGNGRVDAVLTGGASCSGLSKTTGHTASKTGCAICDEYASCDEKLTIAGAATQVVPIKNGVMFVYTSNAENKTHAVQAAVQRRNDRIAEIASAGGDVQLCDGCKSMRGAMASGKLRREVVNIEGGSLTLVTSDDASVVKALQEYSGLKSVKS
jgi:hypothetical protein